MGAAAIARPTTRTAARRTGEPAATLAFHDLGGPLVAVCGLVGGAGTSSLAYLLARRAAHDSSTPVLLAELQEHGVLAGLAGAGAPLGLRELARAVDQGRAPARPFAELDGGLRVVASSRPSVAEPAPSEALGRVLGDARAAHGLVVVDAGPLGTPDTAVLLLCATHALFVMSASVPALRRAESLGAAGLLKPDGAALTTLVAVATHQGRPTGLKETRRLAERHVTRLVLVPHIPELAAGDHVDDAPFEDTFTALATLLRSAQ